MGLGIQHDVVQLGVVVSHPQGQDPLGQLVHQGAAHLLMGQGKVDLLPHLRRPAQRVPGHGLLELPEAGRGVVEIPDGFVEGLRREVGQCLLEAAEGQGALIKVLRAPGSLQADAVFYVVKYPPVAVRPEGVPALPGDGGNQVQGPPGIRIFPAQVGGDGGDIFLQSLHIRKCQGAHLL